MKNKFGLLGEHLSHSHSPTLHALLGDYEYRLYEVSPGDVEDFLRTTDLDGMNVTVPYKKTVVPYCAELSLRARRAGCVNTLIRRDTGWYGDNTDIAGATLLLSRLGVPLRNKKTLIFGNGGAAAAFRAALSDLGAGPVITVSRSGPVTYDDLKDHRDARILINATPLGMYPRVEGCPADPADFPLAEAAADAVYNPLRTEFLQRAETCGQKTENGLSMLVAQAIDSAALFTGGSLPLPDTDRILSLLRGQLENIVLIGMPGSGKTTLGNALAQASGRPFFDTDELFLKKYGTTPAAFITARGEAEFRPRETAVLRELSVVTGAVIATGGGCVTRRENYPLLHRNGRILQLRRALSALSTAGRPLSEEAGLDRLYAEREPLYRRFADEVVENNGTPEDAVRRIFHKEPQT